MLKVKISKKINLKEEEVTPQSQNQGLNTFGDLKNLINSVIRKEKAKKVGGVAVGTLASLIPGMDAVKTSYDLFKAVYSAPDGKKTNSIIDKFNVDDDYSKIVDDKVEESFIEFLTKTIGKKPDNEKIPQEFNINAELQNYLKSTYNKRTLTYSAK